jgi:hypothetical protein
MLVEMLSRDELKELTGLQKPQAIRNFLDREKIPFLTAPDGWPRVLRVVVLERLGGQVLAPPPAPEPQLRLRHG